MRLQFRHSALAPTLICVTMLGICATGTCYAGGLLAPCEHCDVLIGVGTTFGAAGWTHGFVVPITLELEDSRWELGAFRFATAEEARGRNPPPSGRATNPYWGFTAMRRWQVLHRRWGRIYLGFGANYRTEIDYLEATRWNFAWLAAVRFDLGTHHKVLELGLRHWSDAWISAPNRGENFLALSLGF
jgi:Lipid A 3-O-deacylase (PagL)